jgi:UDP-N-acetylmuramoylalanine--D-glutamate ligase
MSYPELDLAGKAVTVLGFGVEGIEAVRYLVNQGARVTVSDARLPDQLTRALRAVEDLSGVRYHLGANDPQDLLGADLVVVSPGVSRSLPALAAARAAGKPLTSVTRLFFLRCRGQILGITGSSGKTTTTSLVGAIFARSGRPSVLGGNLGRPLINMLDEIDADTTVVLEISHSQLDSVDRGPHVACVTNVTPNHLDEFSWEEYQDLKRKIVRLQRAEDIAVLNADDPIVASFAADTPARKVWFSMSDGVPGDGAFLRGDQVVWREKGREEAVLSVGDVALRGRHNVNNVVAAVATCRAMGLPADLIREGVRNFRGVEHRLELVGTVDGALYYNDSIATTPERTLAGLRSFEEPVVLLVGGRDKHLPLEDLVREARARAHTIILFGESAPKLRAAFEASGLSTQNSALVDASDLASAVGLAHSAARPGDVVLLSPACTSFDAYRQFEERGEHFRRLVSELPGFTPAAEVRP